MLSASYFLTFSLALLTATISAQCVTPGYVPCLPQGSTLGGVAPDDFDNSGFWDTLQGVASDPAEKKAKRNPLFNSPNERRALEDRLTARQGALCCAPDPDKYCLLLTDGNIPFCYDTTTTRFVFSDESYGYIDNGTYYAADGTFVDFQDGTYSMTDGETGSFAAATSVSAKASGTPAATVPGTGKVTSVAAKGGSGGTTPSASPASSNAGSGGTSPSPSSGSSSSSSSGSQPKQNQGMELRIAGVYTLSALAAGFILFAVL